jgi:hypothetical protein
VCEGFSNFQIVPAPVAVITFVGLGFSEVVAVSAFLFLAARRRRRLAKLILAGAIAAAVLYLFALLGLSIVSHEQVAARGEEKYFCEVDCHLAYSVVGVENRRTLAGQVPRGLYRLVTVRVRFDEETIARWRPHDMSLTPNSRLVRVIDASGKTYPIDARGQNALVSSLGPQVPLTRPLNPGESYETRLVFDLPANVLNPRLLITESFWPTLLLLGHENSFFHGKTSWAL